MKKEENANVFLWRQTLREILRNTSAFKIREWCKSAGITGVGSKTLVAYAEGLNVDQLALACGYGVRSLSRVRLRALKQLRSYLVSNPAECPKFVCLLSENLPFDGGPMPFN